MKTVTAPTLLELVLAAQSAHAGAARTLTDARSALDAGEMPQAAFLMILDTERYAAQRAERLEKTQRTNQLIQFIRVHGHQCGLGADGNISAVEVICIDGVASEQTVSIEPTWKAVRLWLGY